MKNVKFPCPYDEYRRSGTKALGEELSYEYPPECRLPIYTNSGCSPSDVMPYLYQDFVVPVFLHHTGRYGHMLGVSLGSHPEISVVKAGRWDTSPYRDIPIVKSIDHGYGPSVIGISVRDNRNTYILVFSDRGTNALYGARTATITETDLFDAIHHDLLAYGKGLNVIDATEALSYSAGK